MQRSIVRTAHAPAAIGPYSQAVVVPIGDGKRMVFCSGQIALDPATGVLIEGDVVAQTRQVLENFGRCLAAAGCGFDDVIKVNAYITDMANFAGFNAVYSEYFTKPYPVRTTVEAGLAPGLMIEIEGTARKSG